MILRLARPKRRPPAGGVGNCDERGPAQLSGWAWRPDAPEERLVIEQWVDGVLRASARADLPRADLADAGIGAGAYGWRMLLALDPQKSGPQKVEVRVHGGDLLESGAFDAEAGVSEPHAEDAPPPQAPAAVEGCCDGVEGGVARGWAWRPVAPEERVVVEQWVDAVLVATTVADIGRADLEAAGVGDGRYGWELPLALDPAKAGPQRVELRIRGAGAIGNGAFVITAAELEAATAQDPQAPPEAGVIGRCDGLRGSALYGWAWDRSQPETPVEVELWIDGVCVERALADGFRPDLRTGGVGTGRYGWRLPVDLRRLHKPVQAEVRSHDGEVLDGGRLELRNNLALDDADNVTLRPFVEAVLAARPQPGAAAPAARTFLLHCPAPTETGKFWAREHDDYPAAMAAFAQALAGAGEVVTLDALDEAAQVCERARAQGSEPVLLVFGPPRRAPIEAPCPMVPVFGWAFPTLPTGAWDGDPRSDWRKVLDFTGRAITFSRAAADAVRAAMGSTFPVAALAPPVLHAGDPALAPAPRTARSLRLKGVVFDSREHSFDPEKLRMPARLWSGEDEFASGRDVTIEGVIFASHLDLDDKRKNWEDLVSAFIAAHREHDDATLLIKLDYPDAGWMAELYKWLAAQPAFACRILAVRGPTEQESYSALIAASHWYVSASNAEALCLPLQEFLAAGRPAIGPQHTALADHLDATNALILACDEEDWRWPMEPEDGGWSWTQHPDDVGPTSRWRVSWQSLAEAYAEGYRLVAEAPQDYARLHAAAAQRARAAEDLAAVAARLDMLLADLTPAANLSLPRSLTLEPEAG